MLITEIYNGQGLGNQLWCYTVTKTIALDLNYEFGIQSPHKFKGYSLFPYFRDQKNFGLSVVSGEGPEGGPPISLPQGIDHYYRESRKSHTVWDCDISPLDNNMRLVSDNTKIDGNMQAEEYILHRKQEISDWLTIDSRFDIKDFSNEETCVINLRGTYEYRSQPQVFLPRQYYLNAIHYIRTNINSNMKFVVITDDIPISREFFPDFDIYHESTEWDYGVIHNAQYLIMPNSSFPWFAAWTSTANKLTIAPKYWARHNISDGFWSQGDSLTKNWLWLNRNGETQTYEDCLKEKILYENL